MKTLHRKLRKLKNNPKLFFRDFVINKKSKIKNIFYKNMPKQYNKEKKFTIISAVYNVGDYLDDFLCSLENQRLDFKTNINVILVDDGSTDNSKIIIHNWIKRYPENIFYIHKKNGGQASARNLGIKHVKTDWVTFVDPDDFLDVNYFYLINKHIEKEENVGGVITKFKLFKEKLGTYHDGFQTDFCFNKNIRIVNSKDLEDCVQFSSSSMVYKYEIIEKFNITFDHKLTASFEDTKYFYEYLYHLPQSNIVYIKDALYYYRLRASENSSSNNQWKKKPKYIEFFKNGLLEVIELFRNENGNVPVYIQRLVLFSIIPYLQVGMINRSRIENVLNNEEKVLLIEYISTSLKCVDKETIEKFYNAPGNFFWISSILNYFRSDTPKEHRVYINKLDVKNNLIYFRTYGKSLSKNKLYVDNTEIEKISERRISYKLFDKELICEFNSCYRIKNNKSKIRFEIDNEPSKIYTDFKVMNPNDEDIYKGYVEKESSFKDIILFVDSGYKADDNAEHLYRNWLNRGYLNRKEVYYLLDRNSPHWNKLLLERFNLLDINSVKAIKVIKEAKYIFSSYLPGHLNQWIINHSFKFQKFIFLQHGVVTSNLSKPFNASYSQIYKMVISTNFEKEEILNDKFNYIFHNSDIIYSGIPRLDRLFRLSEGNSDYIIKSKKKILICPTWRTSLSMLNLSLENNIDLLFNSEYISNWCNLLNNKQVKYLLYKEKISITFCMHQELSSLLEKYNLTNTFANLINENNITILNPREINYQELFINHDLLITDFSSLHFDFAVLGKPVIYFQFDKDTFYGVSHAYQKGIFDFEKHGFGPVLIKPDQVSKFVREFSSQGRKRFKKYSNRYDSVYLNRDGNSSDLIFNSIFTNKENHNEK